MGRPSKKPPKDKAEPRKPGRPSSFRAEYVEQGRKLAELGATDREIASFFGVAESTVYLWQHQHPEFSEALKVGKDVADDRVEKALYRKAIGYTHDAVKIMQFQGEELLVPYEEHHAPDTTACIFWLKNRRRDLWRDKIDHEHSGAISLADTIREARERAAGKA